MSVPLTWFLSRGLSDNSSWPEKKMEPLSILAGGMGNVPIIARIVTVFPDPD